MTATFECQDNDCEAQPETPAEAMVHAATTGHTLTKETDEMTMTISIADDEDEGDSEA